MSNPVFPILLIENDNAIVQLIQHLLGSTDNSVLTQDFSFSLSVADNLPQGLQLIEDTDFSAVILDLTLPDTQNFEALLKIKEKLE